MKKLANILVIRTDRIGDVVLTTPAIKALHKAYPLARITVLLSPSTKDLLSPCPYIKEIMLDERQGKHKGIIGFLQLARDIRIKNFDAVFVFHTKRRYNLACFLAGIPNRIGYKNDKFGFLLTHPLLDIRPKGEKHETQYCLDVLKGVGVEAKGLDLFVATSKEAESWANQWLSDQGLIAGEYMAIHTGSSDLAKCWPVEKFSKLIDEIQQKFSFKIVLVGGKDAVDRTKEILSQVKVKPLDLTGQTSLSQTISILRRARVLISNDSGPVHIAAAVGIYVVSLFMRNQPGINPERWKPLSNKGIHLYSPQGIEVKDILELIQRIFHKDYQNTFHW